MDLVPLSNMASSKTELLALINARLASGEDITAAELREVLTAVVNFLPIETFATFSAVVTTGGSRFIYVEADETKGNVPTMYTYDQPNNRLLWMATVVNP